MYLLNYYLKFFVINQRKKVTLMFFIFLFVLFNDNNINCLSNRPIDPIIWSTQNKMFDTTTSQLTDKSVNYFKTNHLIEVRIGEFLNIICPKYSSTNTLDTQKAEYHTLYKVSKEEFDECKINNIETRSSILKCDRPYENVKYTLYISKFSPVPDAIEFTPGSSYYFISTSNGTQDGLGNSEGGTCLTNNMKIIVKVLDTKSTVSTKKTKTFNLKKLTNTITPTSKFYNLNDLQTRNVDSYSMKILSGSIKNEPKIKPSTETPTTTTTTFKPKTTIFQSSKTVQDNIFILEPETFDYNDILSQLISTSSAYSNSEHLNDKDSVLDYGNFNSNNTNPLEFKGYRDDQAQPNGVRYTIIPQASCSTGMYYNSATKACDLPENVTGC
ncbi:unnamed protein product [Brachionus calyciflorus]|uniref:Ephrin RBD domain-containing protein n=1 Tax=Brachionus calyciflorus TaxID=104777 RepID=A0A813SDY1_9BILA|nr:unnamed protein product [Brachionus calyciflorus]